MKKRIYGLETEYAIIHYPEGAEPSQVRILSEADMFELISTVMTKRNYVRLSETQFHLDRIGSRIVRPHDRINTIALSSVQDRMFLGNGARFYLDTGGHPEYATPECLTPRDVLIYDKAGERVLEELALAVEEAMREVGYSGEIFVCKNNVDTRGNTYGCHENYLMERRRTFFDETNFFRQIVYKLIPFLITRQIFCGAGKIYSGEKIAYQVSQRADYIDAEISSATTSRRGIVNAKDEPLSHREKYRRLHLIVGDTNMSEVSSFLKIATTGIVLRLIEEGAIDLDLMLEDPVLTIKKVSRDLSCKKRIKMRKGDRLDPIEIQLLYLELAKRFYAKNPEELDPQIELALRLWEEVLYKLAHRPELARGQVDWLLKKWLLDRYLAKHDSSFEELGKWSFFIKKLKSFRLESELVRQQQRDPGFDVREFLKTRLSQIDFIQLDRHAREESIPFGDYFRIRKIYHGLVERDLRYHDIVRHRSLYYLLQREGVATPLPDPDFDRDVERAKTEPPDDTRAKVRGEFVRRMNELGYRGGVRWDAVYIYVDRMKKIDLLDPFQSTSPHLQATLDSLGRGQRF